MLNLLLCVKMVSRTASWSKRFRIDINVIVSKLLEYASIAAPIYGGWGIDTDSYNENCLIMTSKRLLKERNRCHE